MKTTLKLFSHSIGWVSIIVSIFFLLLRGLFFPAIAQNSVSPSGESEHLFAEILEPHPSYSPDEVVQFQIEALAHNDTPYKNAGIEIAYRFASPENKQTFDTLLGFMYILYHPSFRPMLNHQTAHYGELRVEDDQAVQVVILLTEGGERVGYVFKLSKQKGKYCEGCWMTDSVFLLLNFKEA